MPALWGYEHAEGREPHTQSAQSALRSKERHMRTAPIIPWIGGKRRLADLLIPRFPPHTCYVEVFAGGAALYFLRAPAEVEVINDINGELVNLYRVVKHHLEEFVRQFKWALSSRADVQVAAGHAGRDADRHPARRALLLPAAAGLRRQGGGPDLGHGHHVRPAINLLRIEEDLSAAHLRLARRLHRAPGLGDLHATATTGRTRCSTWTRRTGRPRAMACRSSGSNTS